MNLPVKILVQSFVTHPHQLSIALAFAQHAHQAGEIETLILARQTNTGRYHRQIVTSDRRDAFMPIDFIPYDIRLAALKV